MGSFVIPLFNLDRTLSRILDSLYQDIIDPSHV